MHMLQTMKIDAKKNDVLATLRENLSTHKKIVAEARDGYVKVARRALEKKLEQINAGKIVNTFVHLETPQDHSKVYETAIKMLEMHTGETIELDSTQVRNLIMDEWDWKASFIGSNAPYSGTAASLRGDDEN